MLQMLKDRRLVFLSLLVLVVLNSFVFRPPFINVQMNDWWQYNAYAKSLATGHGYTMDGVHFNDFREPGYSAFLALLYQAFGMENFTAVVIIQIFLLAIAAFLVYRTFESYGEQTWGLITAGLVAILPSYGHLTNMVESEPLFVLLLAGIFFYTNDLLRKAEHERTLLRWVLLGVLMGALTLTRVSTLFFLPFLLVVWIFVLWRKGASLRGTLRGAGAALAASIVLVGSWALYVHSQTGSFELTRGRVEIALYDRAVRAELSYRQLTQYALDYLRYGMTNASFSPPSFYELEPFYLGSRYNKLISESNKQAVLATSTYAVTGDIAVKQWTFSSALMKEQASRDIATIKANPGHYLYGTVIEVMKLFYTEPVFYFIENPVLRRSIYIQWVLAYVLCAFGLWQSIKALYRKRADEQSRDMAVLALVAGLFILYNVLIVPWFEVTPRYNTPYLMFYYVIGVAGLVLWRRQRVKSS